MNKKILLNIKNYEKIKNEAEKRGISITALINLIIYNFLEQLNV